MRTYIFIFILSTLSLFAQNKKVQGTVTYLAAGTVYTSLGKELGVQDSSMLVVAKGNDTLAQLKVYAVSSKSSACYIVKSKGKMTTGDIVMFYPAGEKKITKENTPGIDSTIAPVHKDSSIGITGKPAETNERNFLDLRGRMSLQYLTTRYDLSDNNFSQPQAVINMRGKFRDAPLTFELYGNIRSLTNASSSVNQSKLYRMMLQYDDGENIFSAGRFIPFIASGIGYLDGILLSHKFGQFSLGSTFGYQPGGNLQNISTTFKKIAVFSGYQATGPVNVIASAAYFRTYFYQMLNREAVSTQLNIYSLSGLSLYANGEVDLRKKTGEEFALSPSMTNMFFNISYPFARWISLSLGSNAARPFTEYESIRLIPDTLLDTKIRGGVNFGVTLFLVKGVMLMNTYSPRSADAGFAKEFSNFSSLVFNDVLSSGVSVRTSYSLNRNESARSNGYGVYLQRNFGMSGDVSLYYQYQRYTIASLEEFSDSKTFGADVVLYLSSQFSLIGSYNTFNGYNSVSNSLFTELSYRF